MKFLIDAQLPYKLCNLQSKKSLEVIHTDDLPNKARTTDNEIRECAKEQNRILITKDIDFSDSYFLKAEPEKLLLITTGNIKNIELFELFNNNMDEIITMLQKYKFIELNNKELIGHE